MSTPTNEELAERINRGLGITTTLAFRRDGLEALVELAARLRRAERLVKYAGCMNVCATVNGSGGDCDCGYVEAQMAYELRKEQVAGDTPNRKQVRDERDALRTRLAEVERVVAMFRAATRREAELRAKLERLRCSVPPEQCIRMALDALGPGTRQHPPHWNISYAALATIIDEARALLSDIQSDNHAHLLDYAIDDRITALLARIDGAAHG